jgi:cobalt-zinc-cadmium efflux system protein
VEGVEAVHDLHIWSVCSHIVSLSCHINISRKTPQFHDEVIRRIGEMLWQKYAIIHPTIQVDYGGFSDQVVSQDMNHPETEQGG